MTPAEIETAARRKYNSVGSNFFAQAEIFDLIYQAELEIARETKMLEGLTTSSSVAGTRSYAYPTGVLELKRIEYDGQKLERIDLSEDDQITLYDSNSAAQGNPLYYSDWANAILLRPIPDVSAVEIKIYYYKEPQPVTSSSQTLEVPSLFHMSIVDYIVAEMATKDQETGIANLYWDKWYNRHLPAMKAWVRKKRTGDAFNVVKDMDAIVGSFIGNI